MNNLEDIYGREAYHRGLSPIDQIHRKTPMRVIGHHWLLLSCLKF